MKRTMMLVAGALLLLSAPVASAQTTIDAQADPTKAAQTINDLCDVMSNCTWSKGASVDIGYGPFRVVGDATFNCTDQAIALAQDEATTDFSFERSFSTSIEESLKLKLSIDLAEVVSVSQEVEAVTGQATKFSTASEASFESQLAPGFKGYITVRAMGANVSGGTLTMPGGDVKVTDIDLSLPGYVPKGSNANNMALAAQGIPMTPDEYRLYCKPVTGLDLPPSGLPKLPPDGDTGADLATAAVADNPYAHQRFGITVCADGTCAVRAVTGARPAAVRRGTVTVNAGGRTVARGTVRRGRIRVAAPAALAAGSYELVIREPSRSVRKVSYRAEQRLTIAMR